MTTDHTSRRGPSAHTLPTPRAVGFHSMLAISVRQPWCDLVASGVKLVENRAAGTGHRGPIAIHSPRVRDEQADDDPRVRRVLDVVPPFRRLDHTVGAVIAVAQLADVHVAVGGCCRPWGDRTWRGRPAVHLVFADVRRLDAPIPARGFLGVWEWRDAPADLAEAPP